MATEESVSELLREATSSHQKGDIERAKELYLQILEKEPQNSTALDLAGLLCLQCGEVDAAEDFFDSALSVEPDNARFNNHLGAVRMRQNRVRDAEALFRKAIASATDYAEARFNLALACRITGDLAQAEQHLKDSRAIDPDNVLILIWHGIVLRELERVRDSLMVLEDALTKDPANADIIFQMGESFAQAMDFPFAERCYREALEYAPDAVLIHERLSEALRRQERFEESKDAVEAGLALDGENAGLLTALSATENAMGNHVAAIDAAERAIATDGSMLAAYLVLIRSARALEDAATVESAKLAALSLASGNEAIVREIKAM